MTFSRHLHPKQPGYMVEETDHTGLLKYIVNYRVIKVLLQVPMKQEDTHERLVVASLCLMHKINRQTTVEYLKGAISSC